MHYSALAFNPAAPSSEYFIFCFRHNAANSGAFGTFIWYMRGADKATTQQIGRLLSQDIDRKLNATIRLLLRYTGARNLSHELSNISIKQLSAKPCLTPTG